jgi:hypothetical protein
LTGNNNKHNKDIEDGVKHQMQIFYFIFYPQICDQTSLEISDVKIHEEDIINKNDQDVENEKVENYESENKIVDPKNETEINADTIENDNSNLDIETITEEKKNEGFLKNGKYSEERVEEISSKTNDFTGNLKEEIILDNDETPLQNKVDDSDDSSDLSSDEDTADEYMPDGELVRKKSRGFKQLSNCKRFWKASLLG